MAAYAAVRDIPEGLTSLLHCGMSTSLYGVPKPDNDELWELWCLKIFAKKYGVPGLTRYRTRGFSQEGVDLIGTRADGKIVGIQCKLRSTERELTDKEADKDLDKWLDSGLNLGVFAIACSHESTELQKWAKQRSREGLEVTFYAWPNIVDILKNDRTLRDELTDAKRVNDARDELAYSNALIDLRDKMDLYALGDMATTEVREPPLTAAYVSLELSEVARAGDASQIVGGSCSIENVLDTMQAATWSPTGSPDHAADEPSLSRPGGRETERAQRSGNVLLLVGEAGRGKTTLLRYIAVQAAAERCRALGVGGALPEHRTNARALPWRDRVPFYREVRLATAERPIKDLNYAAYDILSSSPRGVASDWPRSVVDAGRALLLLDGVDEVPDDNRRVTLLDEIYELVKQNPQTLFVISARPGAAGGLRRKLAAFMPHEARVQALAGPKLREFIQHWHGAVQGMADKIYIGKPKDTRVTAIAQALDTLPPKLDAARHIKSLMATPLLAALVCAYHLDHKTLPDNQTKLMTNLAICLIDYHDRQRPGMPVWPAYSRLDENEKLSILETIAAEMVERLSPTITCNTDEPGGTAEFDRHIQAFMKTAQWFQKPDLPDLRKGLSQRTGVLHELQRGVLSFIHNEFRDFLAARHLAPKADDAAVYQSITKAMANQDWHGLLFFAVTADRDKQRPGVADNLVADLLRIVHNPPTHLLAKQGRSEAERKTVENYLSLRRVAFRLAGAKPPVTAERYAALQQVRKLMLPPASVEDAEIISELGINAVPALRFNPKHDTRMRAACVYALGIIEHPDAQDALQEYAQNETEWNVLRRLPESFPVAEIALVSRGIVDKPASLEVDREVGHRLVRQAAGLVAAVPAAPARALLRWVPQLALKTEEEVVGLFASGSMDESGFAVREIKVYGTAASDASMQALARAATGLTALTMLDLSHTQVTDAGVQALASAETGFAAMGMLNLSCTKVTDAGVQAIASAKTGLKILNWLDLSSAQVTDAGVQVLANAETGLKALIWLDLSSTKVTDAGVKYLARPGTGLKALATLALLSTQVTDGIVQAVKARFPGIRIIR